MYTLFSAVSRLTTETIDSGGTAKLSIANRKTSTNILVLSSSNKTSTVFNMRKMNHILMPRLSKRNSSTFNVNQLKKVPAQPISSKIQKSIAKLSNQRPIIVGGETSPTGTLTNLSAKPQKTFDKIQCNLCDMTFFYKSSLAAHLKNHATINTCQHCHRSFAIPTGLFKHLREHCARISIGERKKLLENDHSSSDLNRTIHKTPVRTPKLSRSTYQLLDFVYKSCSPAEIERLKAVPVKHFPPIKGMGHTPRKLINCFKCGEKFKNPFSYATHAEHCVPM